MIQLLTTNRRALRNDAIYNELKAKIQRYSLERNDIEHTIISEKASKQLQKVLLEVLNMFGREQTVWIVVDRPDQCKRRPGPNHQKKLVKALVNLVESANVKIRILLVVNGHDWRVNEQIDEFGQQKENSVVVHTVRQRTVDN
ncbi:hypothetical protein ColTof4_08913 [Colletotrichum tofieldiae]|nr:hypothetical protein ColTof3_03881 [Colletotrichum tofieldiae]GKT76490.1 hypothetical protein ColTof4_08913 [Colletotrichum tofieldiae]GKT87537.1 hypothetical protein Ct61P_05387 [Colletotrichum tofieldiae]